MHGPAGAAQGRAAGKPCARQKPRGGLRSTTRAVDCRSLRRRPPSCLSTNDRHATKTRSTAQTERRAPAWPAVLVSYHRAQHHTQFPAERPTAINSRRLPKQRFPVRPKHRENDAQSCKFNSNISNEVTFCDRSQNCQAAFVSLLEFCKKPTDCRAFVRASCAIECALAVAHREPPGTQQTARLPCEILR